MVSILLAGLVGVADEARCRVNALFATFMLGLVLSCCAMSRLLTRIDDQAAEVRALASQSRLHAAELEVLRVEIHQLAARPTVTRDAVARQRLEALRFELLALVKRGKAEIEGSPAWANWGFE